MKRKKTYSFITSAKDIEGFVGFSSSNIRKNYLHNPKKLNHLKCLDLGTFILTNNVTIEEILLALKTIKATKKQIMEKI